MNTHNPAFFRDRTQSRDESVAIPSVQPERRPARVVSSQALFNGTFEIGIDHAGSLYRLKITRQGKLILNK